MRRTNGATFKWASMMGALASGMFVSVADHALGADKDTAGKPTPAAASSDKDAWRQKGKLGVYTGHSPDGVKITGVMPGGPAERAGVKEGDLLRRINGERMHSPQELSDEIADFKPGEQVEIVLRRDGERVILKATLAARSSLPAAATQPTSEQLIQQIKTLQQQINHLQRQVNQPPANASNAGSGSSGGVNNSSSSGANSGGHWWGSGSSDDDPDLFQ